MFEDIIFWLILVAFGTMTGFCVQYTFNSWDIKKNYWYTSDIITHLVLFVMVVVMTSMKTKSERIRTDVDEVKSHVCFIIEETFFFGEFLKL